MPKILKADISMHGVWCHRGVCVCVCVCVSVCVQGSVDDRVSMSVVLQVPRILFTLSNLCKGVGGVRTRTY